ncbi:hypothetical protein K432DRAFT_468730 [Lepidopterella palustris CBS 459.81]|uniref:RING-type domain-containing protein n=1 Tax=Lepidopterella palustris CBS 459.81 TaxID=1314670 RepID=A0A8E2EG57_9PEZI|nr:hypothetical protein K432DRAFT_468730 [Lepidopterella palustris CBS 459.81]
MADANTMGCSGASIKCEQRSGPPVTADLSRGARIEDLTKCFDIPVLLNILKNDYRDHIFDAGRIFGAFAFMVCHVCLLFSDLQVHNLAGFVEAYLDELVWDGRLPEIVVDQIDVPNLMVQVSSEAERIRKSDAALTALSAVGEMHSNDNLKASTRISDILQARLFNSVRRVVAMSGYYGLGTVFACEELGDYRAPERKQPQPPLIYRGTMRPFWPVKEVFWAGYLAAWTAPDEMNRLFITPSIDLNSFSDPERAPRESDCFACVSPFDGKALRLSRRTHIVCSDCLRSWLMREKKNTCPLCRGVLLEQPTERSIFTGRNEKQDEVAYWVRKNHAHIQTINDLQQGLLIAKYLGAWYMQLADRLQ